jgi:hypothetical protein
MGIGAAARQTGFVNGRESVDALHRSTMHGQQPAHPVKTYRGVEPISLPL